MRHDSNKTRDRAVAAADTEPVRPSDLDSHHTVGDTAPIPEVPEPVLPDGRDSAIGLPSGMHERGKLGRFDILDVLGQGGMGVVVAAYDPQLDRKVAIKVLRTRGLTGRRRQKEAARLQREARAMAQLSHPHVVTVYEAGEIDRRVYIVMEYIAGQTLRSWREEQPRSPTEILDVYVKAGRGLAAGHHAGLIHRDFKPDNVLVGFEGRVRVIDFGLARPTRGNDTPAPDDAEASIDEPSSRFSSSGLHARLTTVGSLFGTPLYMAPEQHKKIELDARADQFAFCVSLYEALYNELPFQAETYLALASAVTEGKVRVPPDRPDIPKHVVEALLRGMRPEPDDRFPGMLDLIDALQPAPRAKRLWVRMVAAAVVAVAVTLGAVWLLREPPAAGGSLCTDDPNRFAGIWDAGVRRKVEDALLASHRAHAPESIKRIDRELDRYAEEWRMHRRTVCVATNVTQTQSPSLFELRMHCLERRLDELRALTGLLGTVDPATADHAVIAVHTLPDPAECVKAVADTLPRSKAQAAQIDRALKEMATVRANMIAGHTAEAVTVARALRSEADKIGYESFVADVDSWLGPALSGAGRPTEAEQVLSETLELGARVKDDALVAQTWVIRLYVIGIQLGRVDDALAFEPVVRLAVERADASNQLRGQLEYYLGALYLTKNSNAEAVAAFERALEFQRKAAAEKGRTDDTEIASTLNSLGGAYVKQLKFVEAKKTLERALDVQRRALGPSHPETALILSSLGALNQAFGNWKEAESYHKEALAILEPVRGRDHDQIGTLYYSLGISANGREDYAAALPYYQRSLAIFEKISPTHPFVALSLIGTADCYEELGEPKKGVVDGERALSLMAKVSDPTQLAMAQFILAKALWAAHEDRPRARVLAAKAYHGFEHGGFGALTGLAAVDKWFKKTGTRPPR